MAMLRTALWIGPGSLGSVVIGALGRYGDGSRSWLPDWIDLLVVIAVQPGHLPLGGRLDHVQGKGPGSHRQGQRPDRLRSRSRHSAELAAPQQLRLGTAPGRWVLTAAVLGSGLAGVDATVVNVALPTLGGDLNAGFAGLQWTVNGYTLTLAALILLGGSLGDRFGRRRVFVVGVAWFALASRCARSPRPSRCWLRPASCRASGARCSPRAVSR